LFLGVLSWIEKEKANKQKEIAVKSKNSEKEAKESAVILKDEAVKSESIAKRATLAANNAEKIAIVKSKEAEKSRLEAVKNKNEAITAKEIADDAKNEALESAKKEKIAAESARLASARAKKEEKEANRLKNLSDAIKMAFESEKSFDLKSTDKGIKEAINSYQLYSENTQDTKRQNQIYSALNRALFEGKNFRSKFYKHNLGLKKIEKASNNNLFALLDNSQTVSIIRENLEGLNKIPNVAFSNISDLKFSNNGDKLILSTITGELKIYNTNNFNTISKNLTFESSIKSIQNFTFSGIEYLLVSEGKKYHLINLVNYEKIDSNKLIEFNAYKNIFSKNGNYIASYQKENILLYSFDISSLGLSLKLINTISSSKEVSTLKFLSSTMIATGSQKGVVKIYKISKSGDVSFYKQITNHKDVKISDIDIYQDVGETYIITSSFDNTLNITNLDKLEELITFKDYNGWVTDMYFEETEKKIYSISQDSFLRYWLIDSKDILKLLKKS
jgi:WD40 repeat protein